MVQQVYKKTLSCVIEDQKTEWKTTDLGVPRMCDVTKPVLNVHQWHGRKGKEGNTRHQMGGQRVEDPEKDMDRMLQRAELQGDSKQGEKEEGKWRIGKEEMRWTGRIRKASKVQGNEEASLIED